MSTTINTRYVYWAQIILSFIGSFATGYLASMAADAPEKAMILGGLAAACANAVGILQRSPTDPRQESE